MFSSGSPVAHLRVLIIFHRYVYSSTYYATEFLTNNSSLTCTHISSLSHLYSRGFPRSTIIIFNKFRVLQARFVPQCPSSIQPRKPSSKKYRGRMSRPVNENERRHVAAERTPRFRNTGGADSSLRAARSQSGEREFPSHVYQNESLERNPRCGNNHLHPQPLHFWSSHIPAACRGYIRDDAEGAREEQATTLSRAGAVYENGSAFRPQAVWEFPLPRGRQEANRSTSIQRFWSRSRVYLITSTRESN